MSTTLLADVQNQIQTFWSPIATQELRESFLLPTLVSKQYEGEIKRQGDTVKIYQINAPQTDLKTVGVDADTYTANKLSTSYVELKADKRATSAYEFDDLVEIQSIIDPTKNPQIRQAMIHDIGRQINTYLYSLLVPSTSNPDHTIGSTAAMSNTIMANMREACALAKWPKTSPWYHLLSPQYYSDFLSDNNLVADTYGFTDGARINGQAGQSRYGFINYEDDSLTAASSFAFVPEALLYAAQTEVRFKVSDLHSSGRFGYAISADIVFGGKLGIDGAKKCYKVTAAA